MLLVDSVQFWWQPSALLMYKMWACVCCSDIMLFGYLSASSSNFKMFMWLLVYCRFWQFNAVSMPHNKLPIYFAIQNIQISLMRSIELRPKWDNIVWRKNSRSVTLYSLYFQLELIVCVHVFKQNILGRFFHLLSGCLVCSSSLFFFYSLCLSQFKFSWCVPILLLYAGCLIKFSVDPQEHVDGMWLHASHRIK